MSVQLLPVSTAATVITTGVSISLAMQYYVQLQWKWSQMNKLEICGFNIAAIISQLWMQWSERINEIKIPVSHQNPQYLTTSSAQNNHIN